MTLRLRGLGGEGLELLGELDGALNRLSIFDALDVTFVRMLVR
jgi:hypothetical protein